MAELKIILMRHGRPELNLDEMRWRWINANEFGQLVQAYNDTDLAPDSMPPNTTMGMSGAINVHYCSALVRAKSSQRRLSLSHKPIVDPVFNEADMPHTIGRTLKLPVLIWSILFRLIWLFGFSQNAVSFNSTKARAHDAALLLTKATRQQDEVLLIGHGVFNRLIGNELVRQKWSHVTTSGDGYWSYSIYESRA